MCAYGPIILGYGHPAVEAAVAEQLAGGDCLPCPALAWWSWPSGSSPISTGWPTSSRRSAAASRW